MNRTTDGAKTEPEDTSLPTTLAIPFIDIATLLVLPLFTSAIAIYFRPGVVKKLADAVAGTLPSVILNELLPLVLLLESIAIATFEDHSLTVSQFPIRPNKFTNVRPLSPVSENGDAFSA
ncbi:hypothetical protein D3C74_338000 [compost metagenome]